jgi:hypothetical protein
MWVFDGFADQARRGQVDYDLDPVSIQRADDHVAIR